MGRRWTVADGFLHTETVTREVTTMRAIRIRQQRWLGAAAAVAVLLAGCSSDDEAARDEPPPAEEPGASDAAEPPADEEPGDGEPVDEGPAEAPEEEDGDEDDRDVTPDTDLADGRHAVQITEVDVAGRTVTVDVVQFLTGDEAIAAYQEDAPDDPEGAPPNDCWVRNDNPRLRTLSLAEDTSVSVVRLGEASGTSNTPWTVEDLPEHLDERRIDGQPSGIFWLTLEGGVVTSIDEQYIP